MINFNVFYNTGKTIYVVVANTNNYYWDTVASKFVSPSDVSFNWTNCVILLTESTIKGLYTSTLEFVVPGDYRIEAFLNVASSFEEDNDIRIGVDTISYDGSNEISNRTLNTLGSNILNLIIAQANQNAPTIQKIKSKTSGYNSNSIQGT